MAKSEGKNSRRPVTGGGAHVPELHLQHLCRYLPVPTVNTAEKESTQESEYRRKALMGFHWGEGKRDHLETHQNALLFLIRPDFPKSLINLGKRNTQL